MRGAYQEAASQLYDMGLRAKKIAGPQSARCIAIPFDDQVRIGEAIRNALRVSGREMSAHELASVCRSTPRRCAQIARHLPDVKRCEGDRNGKTYRMREEGE